MLPHYVVETLLASLSHHLLHTQHDRDSSLSWYHSIQLRAAQADFAHAYVVHCNSAICIYCSTVYITCDMYILHIV